MFTLNLRHKHLRKQLDIVAASGQFDSVLLDDIRAQVGGSGADSLRYYLSSLYLQLGELDIATDLLERSGCTSREMKKFCRVLIHCKQQGLVVPDLSTEEHSTLNYLEQVLDQSGASFASVIQQHAGVLICGNAPMEKPIVCPQTWCRIYFNDYLKNPGLTDKAVVHVITPSWDQLKDNRADYLCITGNDIFYRRSNVWKRFFDCHYFKSIFTVPRNHWANLYRQLGASPSAGLLMLSYLEEVIARGVLANNVPIVVAGFSSNQSGANHSYDSVPASKRHDWGAEKVMFDRLLVMLQSRCANLQVEI